MYNFIVHISQTVADTTKHRYFQQIESHLWAFDLPDSNLTLSYSKGHFRAHMHVDKVHSSAKFSSKSSTS